MDIMERNAKSTLVSVDCYSGYILIDHLQAEKTGSVIKVINSNFQKFGHAETVQSDNGPCFRSEESVNFVTNLKSVTRQAFPTIMRVMAEQKGPQTVKNMIKKCDTEEELTLASLRTMTLLSMLTCHHQQSSSSKGVSVADWA